MVPLHEDPRLKAIDTPWGHSQYGKTLQQGLFFVGTASHGGYYVGPSLVDRIPREQQEWAAKWSGDIHWYEEDCCWAAVALAFPEHFPADAQPRARQLVDEYCPAGRSCVESA